MEFVLLIGLSLIGAGILFWIRSQRPVSPLLEEESLHQLYGALEEVFQKQPQENPAYTHTKSGLLLSYLYQHELHKIDDSSTPIHLHNFSLTIPKNHSDVLCWTQDTQRQITHFLLNTLKQQSVHAVMSSKHGILMINLLFTKDELHNELVNTPFNLPSDPSVLLKSRCNFELQAVPHEMEQLIENSQESLDTDPDIEAPNNIAQNVELA